MPAIPSDIPPTHPHPDLASRPRVLVVDDSEPNRRLAEVLVRRHGFEVASAVDGSAALALLEVEPFDLVLLDAMMPGLDGPAVAREVRRREAAAGLAAITIVAVTAGLLPEDTARMLDAGMDDLIAKPLRAEDLDRVLDRRFPAGTARRTSRIVAPATAAALGTGAAAAPGPGTAAPGPGTAAPGPGTAAPGPGAEAPPAGDGSPILDVDAFGRLVELGDRQLVERVFGVLLADAAERVAEIDDALGDRDAVHVAVALGALEGICDTLGAIALGVRARSLQDELRGGEVTGDDPVGPSGLGPLLDATRAEVVEQLAAERGSPS